MRSDLREDYFSSQVKEILPVLMKKPGQMELEAAAHTVSIVKKQRKGCRGSAHFLLFTQPRTPSPWDGAAQS